MIAKTRLIMTLSTLSSQNIVILHIIATLSQLKNLMRPEILKNSRVLVLIHFISLVLSPSLNFDKLRISVHLNMRFTILSSLKINSKLT